MLYSIMPLLNISRFSCPSSDMPFTSSLMARAYYLRHQLDYQDLFPANLVNTAALTYSTTVCKAGM